MEGDWKQANLLGGSDSKEGREDKEHLNKGRGKLDGDERTDLRKYIGKLVPLDVESSFYQES